MRIKTDLHIHSNFSDGKDSPRDIVLAAVDMGLKTIGFTDHSYTPCDTSYCMQKERIEEYKACIRGLQAEFSDRIRILCGIEQDLETDFSTDDYDYVIGSVHYFRFGDETACVDHTESIFLDAAERFCGGDIYALAENYYARVASLADRQRFNIVGHFDLISKFNEDGHLFDPEHPRYRAAWQAAADRLLQTHRIFEINTGAISRGYRATPYPSAEIIAYLKQRGAILLLSSDSHSKETLAFQFDMWDNLL